MAAGAGQAELSKARTLHTVSIIIAVVAFLTLVYGFGEKWDAWAQVAAGLVAYLAVEWQRRLGRRIKELQGGQTGRTASA